jgi:hypothetical protein
MTMLDELANVIGKYGEMILIYMIPIIIICGVLILFLISRGF